MIPGLQVIPNVTDLIVDISRQLIWVASLILEYKKLSGGSLLYLVELKKV